MADGGWTRATTVWPWSTGVKWAEGPVFSCGAVLWWARWAGGSVDGGEMQYEGGWMQSRAAWMYAAAVPRRQTLSNGGRRIRFDSRRGWSVLQMQEGRERPVQLARVRRCYRLVGCRM